MAYVSVAEWKPEQVTEWLKGLDNSVSPYIHWFANNEVDGQKLMNLCPDELSHLGVHKVGHQELILEAVQLLRNFHYDLDRENLQLLALGLSCAAHSLHNLVKFQAEKSSVPTEIMADCANVISYVKPLVSWLDRQPFADKLEYSEYKSKLLSLSLEMATCAHRDRFADRPVTEIRHSSLELAKLADHIIQDVVDPMLLQPASLDLATIKKRVGEDLGFFLVPSFLDIHEIGDMKLSSPAHQSQKIQKGDEIVQVNYQTVVGWCRKKVLALFEESPSDLLLTIKRRPRHVNMYGQIYMKPYRLPSRKRASPYSRWNDNLPSPRPELLTIPDFDLPRAIPKKKVEEEYLDNSLLDPLVTSSSSDEESGQPLSSQSPTSMRIYLPKPRARPVQRRYTLSGPFPISGQNIHVEQFWRELLQERNWLNNKSKKNATGSQNLPNTSDKNVEEMFQLRDKSASFGNTIAIENRTTSNLNLKEEKIKNVEDLALSRSEINKLKREAFFNNMNTDNIEPIMADDFKNKCAKIVEKPKSNKVMELIGNFEKQEKKDEPRILRNVDVLRERGRLDKSYSTPAYDFNDNNDHGQIVNTINNLLPDGDMYGKVDKYESGEIINTVNLALKELNEREEEECRRIKPIPLQRKLKPANLELEPPSPLPPKPRPKPAPRSPEVPKPPARNQSPPEPPPRPENTLKREDSDKKLRPPPLDCFKKSSPFDEKVPRPLPSPYDDKCRHMFSPKALNSPNLMDDRKKSILLSPVEDRMHSRTSSFEARSLKPIPPLPSEDVTRPLPSPSEDRRPTPSPRPLPSPCEDTRPIPSPRPLPSPCEDPRPTPSPRPLPSPCEERGLTPRPSPSVDRRPSPLYDGRTEERIDREKAVPVLSITTEKLKASSGTLESLKAMFVRKPSSFHSPRTVRKKSAILAKRRNITVKDIVPCECFGVLWHRHRKGASVAQWTEAYFVIQGTMFYGFKNKESPKADLFIHLPGFTCTVAEEVKSKNYAFKIYHTGTVFYFAAKSEEQLQQWLDYCTMATVTQDEQRIPDTLTFSETDSEESEAEVEPETCFPTSPKVKKFLGSSPKPARSHQNLASDSKKTYDIQKKFGSLKKYSSPKQTNNETREVASLDRKYLKFLGQRNNPVPVPTSQFRSYRRMQPSTNTTQVKHNNSPILSNPPTLPRNNVVTHLHPRDQPRLARGTLHASNPSLIHPEMADYRITQERLREFGRVRNQSRSDDMSGFVTLEQFMLYQQEEERMMRSNRANRTRVYPAYSRDPVEVASRSNLPPKPPLTLTTPSDIQTASSTTIICDEANEDRVGDSLELSDVPLDYPGIEYPPIFEPETYTLTDAQLHRNRKKKDKTN